MRSLIALTIVLCVVGGLYLLQGPPFFWPDRIDPSHGVYLHELSSRLLGGGLLAIAALGGMAIRQANLGQRGPAPRGWQLRYFLLALLALGLVSAAFTLGERAPNPDWREPGSAAQPT